MTKSGLAESISACESLLEKGSPVDALVELLCLEKEAASLDDSDLARADGRIAKLITTGKDRREAIARMSRALGEYMITGVKTTIPFEQAVMRDPNFRRGKYTTNFIENLLANRREMIERDA